MAAPQRPPAAAAFTGPAGPPAWKNLPGWAGVATGDKAAGSDVVRSMAERAGADIAELEGSHVIMISQPQAVTDHILRAMQSVGAPAGDRLRPAGARGGRRPRGGAPGRAGGRGALRSPR